MIHLLDEVKIGKLRDEAYEKLDYLSQLTEIVVSPQNEVLGRLPDQLELNFDYIKQHKNRTYGYRPGYELSLREVLAGLLDTKDLKYLEDIVQHFQFETSDELEIDFNDNTLTGTLRLIKVNKQIEEKKLLEMAVGKSCSELNHWNWSTKSLRDRLITVINTLEPGRGTTWAQGASGKMSYSGQTEVKTILTDLILENKWRIRDAGIIVKIGQWINAYLTNGAELGLINLLKLRIMVDKDLPIYSVDEVKNVNPT